MERYRPLRRLTGYFSTATAIFEVYDNQDQCLKLLKVLQEGTRSRIERLRREYNALLRFNAPGRIPRPDLDGFMAIPTSAYPGAVYCFALERIEGQTLRHWIDQGNCCSQATAIKWLRQIIELVALVHDRYYLHRDIKPDNLVLHPDGHLALIDFGACRRLSETYFVKLRLSDSQMPMPESSRNLTVVGSAGYTPPEQLNGTALPQSDLFAIARTLVHAVTGIHPARLPTAETTGRLLWRDQARQIDRPFADLIDELQDPNWRKRPIDVPTILQRIDQLPRRIQRYRILRSTQFKVVATIVTFSVLLSAAWMGQAWAVSQRLSQARHAVETGANLQLNGEFQSARQSYLKALELDPEQIAALNNLGLLCKIEKNFDCAVKYYQQALQVASKTASARTQVGQIHFNLGNVYEDQGERDQAITQYQLAIQADPVYTLDARNNLARLKNLQGKYGEAEQIAEQALAQPSSQASDPISVSSLKKNLGWSLLKQSKSAAALSVLTEAQQILTKAQQLNSSDIQTSIYCLLAQTYGLQSKRVESQRNWYECISGSADTDRFPEIVDWRRQYLNQVDPLPKF